MWFLVILEHFLVETLVFLFSWLFTSVYGDATFLVYCEIWGVNRSIQGFWNITSSISLCYDMSIAFSDKSLPETAICCFLFQFPVSSHFLKVIHQLLNIIFIFPSPLSFLQCVLEGSSYTRYDPSSYPSFLFLFVGCFFPSWLFVNIIFLCGWLNWSLSFSSTTFQHIQGISYLLSEVSKSQPYKAMLQF